MFLEDGQMFRMLYNGANLRFYLHFNNSRYSCYSDQVLGAPPNHDGYLLLNVDFESICAYVMRMFTRLLIIKAAIAQ